MKWGMKGIALAALLLSTGAAFAESKIGYIDSARIFAEYKGTEDAQRTFDSEVEQWELQAQGLKTQLDSLEGEYQRQSLMLSETRKRERQQEILTKRQEYETFVQSVWGPQGKLAVKNSELVQPIVELINVILQRLGVEEDYAIVFDASLGGIVYAAEGIDLTDRIIEELNQGVQ